ncbi:MAG: DedA family protein [Deltaproteobacteria bacterium]|nr:DedA family protein [Deltaproteobacteria bacterium]
MASPTGNPTSPQPGGASPLVFFTALGIGLAGLAWGLWWGIQHDVVVHLAALNTWLADNLIVKMGYGGVFLLMFIESSFIPFPSEIIIPPAADLARRMTDWRLEGVVISGVLGSLAGALFNYYLARNLGRSVILGLINRYGRYLMLSNQGYLQSEAFFLRHGAISTFVGRLLPGIRQIVSIPAGLARMNLFPFILFTTLGAAIWVVVLAMAGYWFGSQPDALSSMLKSYSHWLVLGGVLLIGGYVVYVHFRPLSRKE